MKGVAVPDELLARIRRFMTTPCPACKSSFRPFSPPVTHSGDDPYVPHHADREHLFDPLFNKIDDAYNPRHLP